MKATLWLLVISLAIPFSSTANPLVMGVLEQPQCKTGQKTLARLLFAKSGGHWVALKNEYETPKNLNLTLPNWTIAINCRNLGNIKLRDPNPSAPTLKDWYYGRDKLYEPVNVEKVPIIKNESKSFRGWCNTPMSRPLVIVSQPNFSDPEEWKPFSPDQSYKQRLHVPLKLVIGRFKAIRCTTKGGEHPVPWEFKPEDLIFYKSYRSGSGQELVCIGLDPGKIGCDNPPLPEWSGNWFLLDSDKIEFLGNEMELVDAGDYDKDGRSELLFWHSGYNRDGYVLIYDHFRQKVEYIWNYH